MGKRGWSAMTTLLTLMVIPSAQCSPAEMVVGACVLSRHVQYANEARSLPSAGPISSIQLLAGLAAEASDNDAGATVAGIIGIAAVGLYHHNLADGAGDRAAALGDLASHDHAHVLRQCGRWVGRATGATGEG